MSVAPNRGEGLGPATALAFSAIVVFGGANFVAAHFSNQELPPFFGAGIRFAVASMLFLLFVAGRRLPLPRGSALVGTALFGVLLGVANALTFWAIVHIPAGVASLVMAAVPLFTLFLARAHGLESLHARGLAGGALALGGIAALRATTLGTTLPLTALAAMVLAAVCAAEAGVIVKRFPPSHPAVTNGLAMAIGTAVLLIGSLMAAEQWRFPTRAATWLALSHLVLLGSVAFFALYLFVLGRWTASGAAYSIVLMPLVAALLGAWLAGQPVTLSLAVAGAIVLAGVYFGALSRPRRPIPAPVEEEALAQRCATC